MRRPFVLALLIAVHAAGADAPAPDAPAAAAATSPAVGCWRDDSDGAYLRVAADGACTILQQGQRLVGRATITPDTIALVIADQSVPIGYRIEGDLMHVTIQGKDSTYHRAAVPDEMDPKPLPLGAAKPDARRVGEIQAELAKRVVEDQAVRTDPAKQAKMAEVDRDDTAWLKGVVQDVGWIDCDRFGATASDHAFLLVQHSGDLPLMIAALPLIEKDVRAKKLDGQAYALLYDRTRLYLGGKQRYGSQIGTNAKGEMVVLPLEDRAHVEDRRRELGIFPLAQYLAFFKQQNGGKDVGFSDD